MRRLGRRMALRGAAKKVPFWRDLGPSGAYAAVSVQGPWQRAWEDFLRLDNSARGPSHGFHQLTSDGSPHGHALYSVIVDARRSEAPKPE